MGLRWSEVRILSPRPNLLHPILARITSFLIIACWLAGCAVVPPEEEAADPLEPLNRAIYGINDALDQVLMKPVARAYRAAAPDEVRRGVSNFYRNLLDPLTAVNAVLQGKFRQGAEDGLRSVLNTSFGILGIFDVATPLGLEHHEEDFGQTLARWGVGEGWYVVLPVLGASNVRDAVALLADFRVYPPFYLESAGLRNNMTFFHLIEIRERRLGASRVRDVAALDPYVFTREAYRQYRWNLIYDGNPPLPEFDDEE